MANKNIQKRKIKLRRAQQLKKYGQRLYLCCANFQNNTLWESSASCSFGFIFSFIPLSLIILTCLVSIFKISPGIVNYAMSFAERIQPIINIRPLIDNLLGTKSFRFMDIILALWIIWMARKLFLSIMQGMTKIFRTVSKRKNIFNQLIVFLSEFLIVILIASVLIISFTLNQLVSSQFFDPIREYFPEIVNHNSHLIVSSLMYFVIFVCTIVVYRVISGSKPPFYLCCFYALLNILTFFLISYAINKFVNFNRYNFVYGTISTIVILMMRVYFFFVFFWFYAQMIYVTQFFDTLLLSEIYLLPSTETKGLLPSFRRMMFVNPAALKTTANTKFYKAGETVYHKGDISDCIYYLRKGKLIEEFEGKQIYHVPGDFLGEAQCIQNQVRPSDAVAAEDCKLLIFSKEEFLDLMQKSPKAAIRAISKISDETALIYNEETVSDEKEENTASETTDTVDTE